MQQMGYSSLRAGQEEPIWSIMGGADLLCVLPTGAGKTAIFVLPTLALEWRTLVFSPLIALMRDQVRGLRLKGVQVDSISSNQTDAENMMACQRWMTGELQMLYVAPERMRNEMFIGAMRMKRPHMVVMDEGHCLSQWSDNFRPDYCKVGDFIDEFNPLAATVFTATCPEEVESDIRRVLRLDNARKHIYYPPRTNLNLRSADLSSPYDVAELAKHIDGSCIVYCTTIKNVETMAKTISDYLGKDVGYYHGELSKDLRRTMQDDFMEDRLRIMTATNAFGMGVDKPDIRGVIHYDMPGSPEALMQELGRAGRDGQPSLCMSFYHKKAYDTQMFFIDSGYPSRGNIEKLFKSLYKQVGAGGVVKRTLNDMAQDAGVSNKHVESIIQILTGHKVVERIKATDQVCMVKFLTEYDDNKFKRYRKEIELLSVESDSHPGFRQFDIKLLGPRVLQAETTAKNSIKQWAKDGLIEYLEPFRGTPTKLIGDLSMVDFDRIEAKGREAYAKLERVVHYLRLPDAEKHDFLQDYFAPGEPK